MQGTKENTIATGMRACNILLASQVDRIRPKYLSHQNWLDGRGQIQSKSKSKSKHIGSPFKFEEANKHILPKEPAETYTF